MSYAIYVPRDAAGIFTWLCQSAQSGIHYSAMHYVYLLESKDSSKRYIGYTTDLKRRLKEHNNHENVSTAGQREWKLIYCETYLHKMDALGREKFLKSGSGWRYLKKQLMNYLMQKGAQVRLSKND
jgi:putative endonuclease